MGRRQKRFIDKQRSETYQLIHKSTNEEDTAAEERVLVEQAQIRGTLPTLPDPQSTTSRGCASFGFGFGFQNEELTEDQAREIKELGLPSDGYNYLKHLRTIGAGRSELPVSDSAHQGNSVFIESSGFVVPEAEMRTVNASGLTLRSEVSCEQEAEEPMRLSTTRAFSRIVRKAKGTPAQELNDVDELLQKFEGIHVEEGDLLDSFVLDATSVDVAATLADGTTRISKNQWVAMPEDLSSGDELFDDEDESEGEGFGEKSIGRSRFSRGDMDSSASFSERWKGTDPSDFEGRKERTRALEIIDATFESILEEYDDEQLGELDDAVENGMTLEQLTRSLNRQCTMQQDGFQPESGMENGNVSNSRCRRRANRPPKRLGNYRLLKPESKVATLREKDQHALDATKKLCQSNVMGSKREEWEDVWVTVRSEKALDCESAWSCRTHSTLHQPSLIVSCKKASRGPKSISSDPVKVSSKSGMPIEVEDDAERSDASDGDASDDEVSRSTCTSAPSRNRGESSEERRQRKHAIKTARREARAQKKQTKSLYRAETVRQQKHIAGMITKNASVVEL